jgi:mannosyltransferase OCH1-like enzyme
MLAAEYAPAVSVAFRRARDPTRKADIFRLAYLLRFGGVYVDADDRCVAPLMGLLRTEASLLLYQEDIGSIGNNVIATVPDHPIIRRALDLAIASVGSGDSDIPWLSTGPGLLTRVLARLVAEDGVSQLKQLSVEILERRKLLPFIATCCMTAYKHTPGHWSRAAFLSPRGEASHRPEGLRVIPPESPKRREAI